MAEKRDNVAVKYKDNVFCMLYRDKKNLLELYNALNNSNYINVNDLKVTTLNGGSYIVKMKHRSYTSYMNHRLKSSPANRQHSCKLNC